MAQTKFLNNAIFSLLYSGPPILERDTKWPQIRFLIQMYFPS